MEDQLEFSSLLDCSESFRLENPVVGSELALGRRFVSSVQADY